MPSTKVLEAKKAIVKGLSDELKSAKTLVVADARGLSVAQDTILRAALRKAGVTYKVVKNTLVSRAAEAADLGGLNEIFKGPTAIAYSVDDVIAPAKVMKEFADKFAALELKGGATDGRVAPLSEINAMASIPPIEVLYARVVGGLVSPIAALAIYLNEIAKKAEEAGAKVAREVAVHPAAAVAEDSQEVAKTADQHEVAVTAAIEEVKETADAPVADMEQAPTE